MLGKGLACGAVVVGMVLGWGSQTAPALAKVATSPGQGVMAPEDDPQVQPLAVPETRLETSDTRNGVALVFTTTEGGVAEVRERVKAIAAHHNDGRWERGQAMPKAWASYEELPSGARIVFEPALADDLADLRAAVRHRAEVMQAQP